MNLLLKLAALAPMLALGVLGSHIRKDLVQIQNDAIVVVEASTSIDSSSGRIARLSTSPAGPIVGTRGIVYALPELVNCRPVKRSAEELAESYIRIALIDDDGDCPIEAKITQAQLDGAVGALVYNATLSVGELRTELHKQLGRHQATIPVIAVDHAYGETLRLETATLLSEAWVAGSDRFRAIFATIYPDGDGERLSAWEIALISLVVLLALGFCISLFFHVSPRRRTINHPTLGRTKRIETLPSCALDRLMLRTVTEADVQHLSACTTPLDAILRPGSPHKSIRSQGSSACGNCEKRHGNEMHNVSLDDEMHNAMSAEDTRSTLGPCTCTDDKDAESLLKGSIATCIVCIDDFAVGSKMRILPCGHNFHIECIDPWLTSKSSLCPLCKYDTRSVLTDLERAYSGPQVTVDTDVFNTSSEPSSFLAESGSRMDISAAMTRLAQKIATPVRALTRKATRGRHCAAASENIAMNSSLPAEGQPGFGDASNEWHNLTINTAIPITYTMSIGEDDTPGMVEQSQIAARPKTSSTKTSLDNTGENQGGSSRDSDYDKYISRLSLTETIPSESDLTSYFK
ncbi:hypothetical protein GGF43_002227 [Coemansia sp. RSA 2618]|nr:hypothetical protein GGF43_002227 [Coemansia sp. RSA 2618]